MAEKIEDLNLPAATVARIIKESLPDYVSVGKDAKSALSRAASVFILYITSQASQGAMQENRKTLMGSDIIKALEELEFDEFIEPLQEVLKDFKEAKSKKASASKDKKSGQNETEDIEDEQDEEEESMEEAG